MRAIALPARQAPTAINPQMHICPIAQLGSPPCDRAYGDILEQALFNGALSGLSRDGTHYFYQNVLESDGSHQRWDWHPCPCCTMNVARLVASIGGYFYSTGPAVLAVHLYVGTGRRGPGIRTSGLSVQGQHTRRIRLLHCFHQGQAQPAESLAISRVAEGGNGTR